MCLMPPETLVLREILTMRTMKMEFWILYMDHVYDKPVTIASELRTKQKIQDRNEDWKDE